MGRAVVQLEAFYPPCHTQEEEKSDQKLFLSSQSRDSWVLYNEELIIWLYNTSPSQYVCGGGIVTKLCLTPVIPWTVAHQAPLSMGFPRQEYCSGLPFPSPGDLLNPGIEPASLASHALASRFFTMTPSGKPYYIRLQCNNGLQLRELLETDSA